VDIYIYIYIYIYNIYYIDNNYMIRLLVMAIFRLHMKHLASSYTKHIYGLLIWGWEGVNWARNLISVLRVGWCGLHGGGGGCPCCYQAMSKLVIDKSMLGIVLCLSVLRNYTIYPPDGCVRQYIHYNFACCLVWV